jgi:hypothetical protein
MRETFIPLDHAHGQRMEADFGKIYVDFPEGRRQVSVLILVWSCSNAPFAMALPTERTESILEGMQQGFEFFGCVPREVWWDNPKTVAEELLIGRDRRMNPRYAAFKAVTVKGFINHIEVIQDDKLVATHVRSYVNGTEILDPLHYLTTLTRRPGALDHSNVYRDWQLPECFTELRSRLEQRHGVRSGVRHFVRVLQLLADHSVPQVAAAIEQLRGSDAADADRIIRRVEYSSTRQQNSLRADLHGLVRSDVTNVKVPSPGLSHFDSLLTSASVMKADFSQGDLHGQTNDHSSRTVRIGQRHAAAEIQSEATEIADDRTRIREAGTGSVVVESDVRAVPAETDRTGSHGASVECIADSHQAGESAGGEGSGQLRLFCDPVSEQAEDSGTCTRRMDHQSFERLSAGSARNW